MIVHQKLARSCYAEVSQDLVTKFNGLRQGTFRDKAMHRCRSFLYGAEPWSAQAFSGISRLKSIKIYDNRT